MHLKPTWRLGCAISIAAASLCYLNQPLSAQPPVPEMLDPDLSVRLVVGGLIAAAFLVPIAVAVLGRPASTLATALWIT